MCDKNTFAWSCCPFSMTKPMCFLSACVVTQRMCCCDFAYALLLLLLSVSTIVAWSIFDLLRCDLAYHHALAFSLHGSLLIGCFRRVVGCLWSVCWLHSSSVRTELLRCHWLLVSCWLVSCLTVVGALLLNWCIAFFRCGVAVAVPPALIPIAVICSIAIAILFALVASVAILVVAVWVVAILVSSVAVAAVCVAAIVLVVALRTRVVAVTVVAMLRPLIPVVLRSAILRSWLVLIRLLFFFLFYGI